MAGDKCTTEMEIFKCDHDTVEDVLKRLKI